MEFKLTLSDAEARALLLYINGVARDDEKTLVRAVYMRLAAMYDYAEENITHGKDTTTVGN